MEKARCARLARNVRAPGSVLLAERLGCQRRLRGRRPMSLASRCPKVARRVRRRTGCRGLRVSRRCGGFLPNTRDRLDMASRSGATRPPHRHRLAWRSCSVTTGRRVAPQRVDKYDGSDMMGAWRRAVRSSGGRARRLG